MTPMMKQWQDVKARHTNCIVFFRLGDFYEMFFDDAEVASKVLGIVLTGRDCGMEKKAPMCGVPHHSARNYIKKLVEAGHRVAIAEQITEAQKGQMVERDVVRVVTAGTYDDETFLDSETNNFLTSIYTSGEVASVAWCDITTGQFYAMNTQIKDLSDILKMISPRETIESNGHYGYAFNGATAYANILRYFNITSTKIFDLEKDDNIIKAAGALLHYLELTQKKVSQNVTKITIVHGRDFMNLDKVARENLEILRTSNSGCKRGSLLWVLDETKTAMGARLLSEWLSRPLICDKAIKARQDAVESMLKDSMTREILRGILAKVSDISRLCGRAVSGTINPKELLSIATSTESVGEVKNAMVGFVGLIKECADGIDTCKNMVGQIRDAIKPDAPVKTDAGGFVRDGYSEKLDELRKMQTGGLGFLSKLEEQERVETNIKELKVAYNKVVGYYFEVPMKHSDKVPYRYTRRGSTMNTERFTTEELKDLEQKVLSASDNAITLENQILKTLCAVVVDNVKTILGNAMQVAILDVIQSFATVAYQNDYNRPKINTLGKIELSHARHPVVEKIVGRNNFISNNCSMDRNTILVTGPNMAGKSTFMRTVAMNVLLAHVGSFVPCALANIPITDRIFTRIGASDNLHTGESTFMTEMNEVSNIVHNATKKSLILLDEVGRGTSTGDGLALAEAILLFITEKIGANTLFATHFHQLTNLASKNPKIKNFKVLTEQVDGQIVFLHKVEPGIEENSFGIDVAKLAGLPKEIIDMARGLYKQG